MKNVDTTTLTEEEISKREFGSKVLLAGWVAYVSLIWSLKACMLFFFNRITYVGDRGESRSRHLANLETAWA